MSAFSTSPPDPSPLARLLHTYAFPRRAARLTGHTASDFPPRPGRWDGLPLPPAKRLSGRKGAKEGALRCEATTNPCHPCDPRALHLSNPNILEMGSEIRTAPRTLPRWWITSPATFAQVQDHGGSIRTFRTSPSRRSSTSSRWWRGCRSWRSRRPPSSTLRAAAVPLLHGLIPRASSDAPSPPRVQERQSLAEARAVAPARPGGGS